MYRNAYEANIESSIRRNPLPRVDWSKAGVDLERISRLLSFQEKIGVFRTDLVAKKSWLSPEIYEFHGLPASDEPVEFDAIMDYTHPEDREKTKGIITQAIHLKTGYRWVRRIIRTDGQIRVIEVCADIVLDKDGEVVGIIGYARDVTELAELTNTKRSQGDLIWGMLKAIPLPMVVLNSTGKIVAVSDRFLKSFNVPEQIDVKNMDLHSIFGTLPQGFQSAIAIAMKGNKMSRERDTWALPNGVKHIVNWAIEPWAGPQGVFSGLMVMIELLYTAAPVQDNAEHAPVEDEVNQMIQPPDQPEVA